MRWPLVLTICVALVMSPFLVFCKAKEKTEDWIEEARQAEANGINPFNFKFQRAPHLRVAAESWPPHIEVDPTGLKGPMGNLLASLSKSINFTYSVIQGDGYWGAPQTNGSWNGMIGMILRKEADFGLGPFGMSPIRSQVVDFTMPLFREVLHVLVARPTAEDNPWGFLSPFTVTNPASHEYAYHLPDHNLGKWYVWVGLLLASFLVAGTLAIIVKVLKSGGETGFLQHLWLTYAIFIGQNLNEVVRGLSLRVALFFWMAAVLIVMKSYSGTMTSLLAIKTIPIKYDSLKDVLDDPKMQILMEGSTVLSDYLKRAESGIYKELAEAVKKRGALVKASSMQSTAYALIPRGRHSMLLEAVGCNKIYSDHFSVSGRCDFYKSKEVFWPLFYALIVPKGSPLRQLIDSKILALREFGIYERWALEQTPHVSHCIKMPTKIKVQEPYSIADLWAVFLLTTCGFALGTVVFGWERILTSFRMKQLK